jgi:3-carboxy-cis,cis-muconate cycloisomerase
MRGNLNLTKGLIVAESVAMALAEKLGHFRAHGIVETASSLAVASNISLRDALARDAEVASYFDGATLDRLLDPVRYIGESGSVVERAVNRSPAASAREGTEVQTAHKPYASKE